MENKNPTIREIAQLAGVSTATVSRFINRSGYVSESSAEAISRIVKSTNYQPSITAQGLKAQKSRIIMLVVPDIVNPFYSIMAKEVQRLVEAENYTLMLYNTNEDTGAELQAISLIPRLYISGLLFASIKVDQDIVQAISAAGAPAILVNSYHDGAFDTVHCSYGTGTLVSTRYLLSLGHTRIGFAGGVAGSAIGDSRREGYLAALNEHDHIPPTDYIYESGFSQKAGYDAGKYFAKLTTRPTAICCANDLVALGLMAAFHDHKIQIPEQISVIGMDDISYARISSPPLSTVTNDGAQFAQQAVSLLFERITGRDTGEPHRLTVPNNLVTRRSCAPL